MKTWRTCHSCGKMYETARADSFTCSPACRQRRKRAYYRIAGGAPTPGNTIRLPVGTELQALPEVQPVEQIATPAKLPRVRKPRPKRQVAPEKGPKKPRPKARVKGRSPR